MAISSYKTKGGIKYKATIWKDKQPVGAKSFRRKIDAQEWLKRKDAQLQDTRVGRMQGVSMKLGEFFHQIYWLNKKVRPGTATDYLRIFKTHIEPIFGKRILAEIEPVEWSTLQNKLVFNGMSKARANRVHAVASAIYSMAMKWRYVGSNPLSSVDYFETDLNEFDYWTDAEATRFLTSMFSTNNPRFTFYQMAYETGMRVSELIALKRDCLDLSSGIITVRRAFCKATKQLMLTTKGGEKRVLGINIGLKASLQKMLAGHSSEYVFCNKKGAPLTHNGVRYHFDGDQAKAEVRRISFHDIRHTYASHYVMRGGLIYDLKELLGHSDIETSMRYAHLAPEHLRAKSALVNFKAPVLDNIFSLNSESPQPYGNHRIENTLETEPLTSDVNPNRVGTSRS